MSSDFKTSSKYGCQPILLADQAIPAFDLYVKAREEVSRRYPELDLENDNSPFWINCTNDPNSVHDNRAYLHLTKVFRRALNIDINTTLIRTLVETKSYYLERTGQISPLERGAIQNINGHSGATCDEYYLLLDRERDSQLARQVLAPSLSSSSSSSSSSAAAIQSSTTNSAEVFDNELNLDDSLLNIFDDDEFVHKPSYSFPSASASASASNMQYPIDDENSVNSKFIESI
jgi:hypothetical protein